MQEQNQVSKRWKRRSTARAQQQQMLNRHNRHQTVKQEAKGVMASILQPLRASLNQKDLLLLLLRVPLWLELTYELSGHTLRTASTSSPAG